RTYYAYHHFRDNCSTRIATILDDALGGKLSGGLSRGPTRGTFRARALAPVRHEALMSILLDIAYTGVVDRKMTTWDATFLPDGLASVLDHLTIERHHFVEREQDLYRSIGFDPDVLWTWPWVKVYVLFLGPFAFLAFLAPRIALGLYGLIATLLGLVV